MKWLPIIVVLALTSAASQATEDTGREVLQNCNAAVRFADGDTDLSSPDDIRLFTCYGYLQGFRDGMVMMTAYGARSPVCLPAGGITNEQAARVIVKELRENPEYLHRQAGELVLAVFIKNFPCKDWKEKLKGRRAPTESF